MSVYFETSTMLDAIYEFGLVVFILLITLYIWLKYHYDYWIRQEVPQISPTFIVGNLGGMISMHRSSAEFIRDLYNHPQAANQPFVGIHVFHKPGLLICDPQLVKRMLIKDFSKFSDRYSNSDSKGDPMGSQNIFFLKNPAWKEVRFKLTPFFSTGRLKHMFHLIEEVGRNLDAYLLQQSPENHEPDSFMLEMKELCALYTTDVIATVAYGVEANSFKYPNGDFRRNGREVFRFRTKRALEFIMVFFLPRLVPYFKFKIIPPDTTEFLRSTINHVMEQRELSGKTRNDLIDILIEFKRSSKCQNNDNGGLVFEGDILVAQAALFFTAGFESSSATMSFALYELAKRLDLQQRLRDEIKQALIESEGQVTQKLIDSLEYMQMIIHEVLRLYPPLPFLDRECTVDEECTGYSLEPFNKYLVPHGMPIYIPVYGLHMDPKYYPNPKNFDPERFSLENRKHLIPYTYMPFGLGSHGCIGERFAMLQTKIGLLYFLRNHYVAMCDRTKPQMKLDPKAVIIQAEGGIYLKIVRDPLNV